MNPRRVYTTLGFTACPLDYYRAHPMNHGRVYSPLGFMVCPLA